MSLGCIALQASPTGSSPECQTQRFIRVYYVSRVSSRWLESLTLYGFNLHFPFLKIQLTVSMSQSSNYLIYGWSFQFEKLTHGWPAPILRLGTHWCQLINMTLSVAPKLTIKDKGSLVTWEIPRFGGFPDPEWKTKTSQFPYDTTLVINLVHSRPQSFRFAPEGRAHQEASQRVGFKFRKLPSSSLPRTELYLLIIVCGQNPLMNFHPENLELALPHDLHSRRLASQKETWKQFCTGQALESHRWNWEPDPV
jgi:hypothetical protein